MFDIFRKTVRKACGKASLFSVIFVVFSVSVFAQVNPPAPPVPPSPKKNPVKKSISQAVNVSEIPAEISVATDASVNISLCINEGKIKINGWDRNEVRALINEGSSLGFKIVTKNAASKPTWLKILGYDPLKTKQIGTDECLSGEEIELDVPRGATVNIKGDTGEFDTEINSVFRASVKNNGGNISINDIKDGITAQTFEGDIEIANSGGSIQLSATNADILVYNAAPVRIADAISVKTSSGSISLQNILHSQVEVSSISGIVGYTGEISGGQYNFATQSGQILLNLAKNSSFGMIAAYMPGNFKSQIPIQNVNNEGTYQKSVGVFGAGNASLNIKTLSGTITINTQNQ